MPRYQKWVNTNMLAYLSRYVLSNPNNLRSTGTKLTVFHRIGHEIAEGQLGLEVDAAMRKQAETWSAMANQVVGSEDL